MQLDDRAILLGHWQKLLLATLTPEAVAALNDLPIKTINGTTTNTAPRFLKRPKATPVLGTWTI